MKDKKSKIFSSFARNIKRNKKALSAVVIMVIMVALVMTIMTVVFTLTKKTVEEKIEKAEACGPNIIGKLSINSQFVCYDKTDEENFEVVFSINRGDIEMDKLIIAIETETEIIQYGMLDGPSYGETFEQGGYYIYLYDGTAKKKDLSEDVNVKLVGKNAGKTYIATGFTEQPIQIQIAPVINGEQCDVVDTLSNIIDCKQTTILKPE